MASDVTLSTELLLTIIFCTIDIIIYVPIQCYSTVKFSYMVKSNISKQQTGYPQLVVAMNIFAILFTLTVHPQIIITGVAPIHTLFPSSHQIFATCTHLEASILVTGLLFIAGTRYWLLYYDLNIINSIMNGQWKLYINSTCIQTDFWFRHRKKWGNDKFISRCFTVLYMLYCMVHCSLVLLLSHDNAKNGILDKINTSLWLIPVLCLSIIYLKSPKMSNNMKNHVFILLKYEVKAIGIWITVHVIIILVMLNMYIYNELTVFQESFHHAAYSLSVDGACLLTMHSTLYVHKKHLQQDNRKYRQISHSNTANLHTEKALKQILCNEQDLEVFIQYLCTESQLNTFFCFIELIQFRYLLDKAFDITLNRNRFTLGTILEDELIQNKVQDDGDYYESCLLSIICDSTVIPKSEIVYSDENLFSISADKSKSLRKCCEIAHDLYCKYIAGRNHGNYSRIQEKLTVELPCTLRKCYEFDMDMPSTEFVEKHCSDKFEDMFEYFDPIIDEMWQKLQDLHESTLTA